MVNYVGYNRESVIMVVAQSVIVGETEQTTKMVNYVGPR